MPGTYEGGKAAARTNIKKYGEDFYRRIGSRGGSAKKTKPGGFAWMKENCPEKISEAGRKGGLTSRRRKQTV